jgi:hypothetical protein
MAMRILQLAPRLFALVALGLVPWALWLAKTLPSQHRSEHWDLAWGGFDVLLAAGLLGTAVAAARRSPYLPSWATAAGTLLVVDAWFDILTSNSGGELRLAIALAACGELPLAALAFCVALDAERFYAAAARLGGWRADSRSAAAPSPHPGWGDGHHPPPGEDGIRTKRADVCRRAP